MKNIEVITALILFILLSSCGYKQINEKDSNIIYIQDLKVLGEPRIAYSLKNNILLLSNKNSEKKYTGEIKINKNKNSKIKNKAGKIIRYNLSIEANLQLTNINDNRSIKKTFIRTGDFEIAEIHSSTIKNENSLTKRIIKQISEDITNFITIAMKNQ